MSALQMQHGKTASTLECERLTERTPSPGKVISDLSNSFTAVSDIVDVDYTAQLRTYGSCGANPPDTKGVIDSWFSACDQHFEFNAADQKIGEQVDKQRVVKMLINQTYELRIYLVLSARLSMFSPTGEDDKMRIVSLTRLI